MTTANTDHDIDLDLDESGTVRYVRPAQSHIIGARISLGMAVLTAAGTLYAGFTELITLESKALPLLMAAILLSGAVCYTFAHLAEKADEPAILIDDQDLS